MITEGSWDSFLLKLVYGGFMPFTTGLTDPFFLPKQLHCVHGGDGVPGEWRTDWVRISPTKSDKDRKTGG